MIDRSEPTWDANVDLPPNLRLELASTPLARRPWYRGVAPAYLGVFVWAVFFDRLWVGDLPRTGLAGLVGAAVLGSILGFLLLYAPTASWGFRTGRRVCVVASSTFGTVGSEWIAGIAIGLAEIVWFAVAIDYAIDSTLLGLRSCGLIPASRLIGWTIGPLTIRSPVFLCTAVYWIFITGSASLLRLTGVIVALMRVYAPVAWLLLAATALWVVPSLASYRLEDAVMVANVAGTLDAGHAGDSVVQLVTGFFAMAGLLSVDWGSVAQRRRDWVVGGLTGIVLIASSTAIMSLLVVAGAVGRLRVEDRLLEAMGGDPLPLSFRWAVFHGIGGKLGGTILILFGLAALAPACYSSWIFTWRLWAHWPRIRRVYWTWWIGGGIAFLLIASSLSSRLDSIFHAMGLVFAPAVGAMAGDFLRQRGGWSGLREGINPAGLIAWGAGCATDPLLGLVGRGNPALANWFRPVTIYAFLAAAVAYLLLASLGLERKATPLSEIVPGEGRLEAEPGDPLGESPSGASPAEPSPSGHLSGET